MTIREATKDWSNVGWGGSFWGMGATGIPPLSSVIREVVNLPPDRFGRKSIYIGIKRPDGSEARGVLPQHVMPSGQDLVMVGEALKSSIGKSLDEASEVMVSRSHEYVSDERDERVRRIGVKTRGIKGDMARNCVGVKGTHMKTNKKQNYVLYACAIVILLMLLFPPFHNINSFRVRSEALSWEDQVKVTGNANLSGFGSFLAKIYNGSQWTITGLIFRVVAKEGDRSVRWDRRFDDEILIPPLQTRDFNIAVTGDENVSSCGWSIDSIRGRKEAASVSAAVGYGFLFLPPGYRATVNTGMLFTQWVCVLIIGGILLLVFRDKE